MADAAFFRACNLALAVFGQDAAHSVPDGRQPVHRWKVLGLACFAGVDGTGVLIVRDEQRQHAYTPKEVRQRLRARAAEAFGAGGDARLDPLTEHGDLVFRVGGRLAGDRRGVRMAPARFIPIQHSPHGA